MLHHSPRFVLTLAAGKGSRMGSADRHKVCFEVDGRPVINRALENYLGSGIRQPVVVVGALASQVMATIALEHSGVLYAYQPEQLGTGNATRVGLQVIEMALDGADADVLLVAGDRIVDPRALQLLYDAYYADGCDLAFLVAQRAPDSQQGRVVFDSAGRVLGIVEMRDVWQRHAYAQLWHEASDGRLSHARAMEIMLEHMDANKAAVSFGELYAAVSQSDTMDARLLPLLEKQPTGFTFAESVHLAPAKVAALPIVNVSVYLGKVSALRYALERLSTDNAQHEEYLSDIVNILRASGRKVQALQVSDPKQVLGYNNPAELLAVEEYFRASRRTTRADLPDGRFRPISRWLSELEAWAPDSQLRDGSNIGSAFMDIYGRSAELLAERREAYKQLLLAAGEHLGADACVALVRSPGRANILGRHIDHQGGNCNLLAINKEVVMVVRAREDDQVTIRNIANHAFPDQHFTISELLARLPWDDWTRLVNSPPVMEMVRNARGDWGQYVRAAVLRLQKRYPDKALKGMDLVVSGNIPIAAGLSSSSALVVATAEAVIAVNNLDIKPAQFVDLCGEGEWFVGTRGGSADHAAIKYGQRAKVTQVTFFPFGVSKIVDFPHDYRLVICNSGIQARKSAGARDVFNHRVACYRLGLVMIKNRYPQYAPLLHHLRDVNTRNLGIPLSWLYEILLSLPVRVQADELSRWIPDDILTPILASHQPQPDGYPVRGVVLFGLAECERSRLAIELLQEHQEERFGELMLISHDGDRVARFSERGEEEPYAAPCDNPYLEGLIAALASGDDERIAAAQLAYQPGAYGCSTRDIDWMVDIARRVPGVAGAQLAGAGLGGCMMVLARQEAVDELTHRLVELYYAPRSLVPDITACTPIAGSSTFTLS